ncbi:hypothetical protein WJX79_006412 [Trebouxia sp. C0005]
MIPTSSRTVWYKANSITAASHSRRLRTHFKTVWYAASRSRSHSQVRRRHLTAGSCVFVCRGSAATMGFFGLIFGGRGTADDVPSHMAGPQVAATVTVDPTVVEVNDKDTKDTASGSSTVPVIANSTLAIHTAARHPTLTTGGAVAGLPTSAAHSDKGKGVLFFHGHIPRGRPRHPADAGAMGQEAGLCYRYKLEDMALHEPLQFVDRNGLATPFFRTVIKDVVYNLQELQVEGKVHGHLTPAIIKVSDEGLVRLEGAVFEATRERQYSSQAYQLGVVLHFCLTGGQCPVLWAPNQLHEVLMGMHHSPTESDLIMQLVHFAVEERPSLEAVLQHPCLWNDMQRLDLLVGLSNYIESMGKGDVGFSSHFQHIMEHELGSAEGWQQAMHPDLMDNMTKYNKFRPDSWQDLLRFVRNMHRHYKPILRKMPPALQQVLGCSTDGVYRYIAPKFPKLLITSYNFVQQYCSQETTVRVAETNLNMIRQAGCYMPPDYLLDMCKLNRQARE